MRPVVFSDGLISMKLNLPVIYAVTRWLRAVLLAIATCIYALLLNHNANALYLMDVNSAQFDSVLRRLCNKAAQ